MNRSVEFTSDEMQRVKNRGTESMRTTGQVFNFNTINVMGTPVHIG